jgi:hypothetical protein
MNIKNAPPSLAGRFVAIFTAHNRIVCAAPPYGGLASEKPQSALRAFVRFFSGTFCPPLELLRNSFIAAVKTSYTTGTLYDIGANFL